jgi:hypothetical protein
MRAMSRPLAKKPKFKVFNLRKVPEETFFRIKMAAAAEKQTSRDWLLALAETRLAELERQGKLPKET